MIEKFSTVKPVVWVFIGKYLGHYLFGTGGGDFRYGEEEDEDPRSCLNRATSCLGTTPNQNIGTDGTLAPLA